MVKRSLFLFMALGIGAIFSSFLGAMPSESISPGSPPESEESSAVSIPASTTSADLSKFLESESPASLLSIKFGEKKGEAELQLRGSWQASLLSKLDMAIGENEGLKIAEVQPLFFSQTPDLFLSFLLLKKIFVEARVSDDMEQARYAFGYRGQENESFREIRAGNDGISFPSFPFLSFGAGSIRSFGLSAAAGNRHFDGRIMIRYDQADRVEKRFVGRSEVKDQIISASQFITGRWFSAPSIPISNLELFIESGSGTLAEMDGRKYRQLETGEYSYSVTTGFIALEREVTTRLAARYSGLASTDLKIDGLDCALLYDPTFRGTAGELDPRLQVLCRYAITDTSSTDAFVRDRASGLRDTTYDVRLDPSGFIEVTRNGETLPSSSRYRRPFESDMPALYTNDFSADGSVTEAPLLTKEIVVRQLNPASEISVDKDIVVGSLEVRRNGIPDFGYTLDPDSGVLELASPPGLQEEIYVSWLRESAERRSGSLVGGIGGIFSSEAGSSAWTALGIRWSLPGQSYAAEGISNPGTAILTIGERDDLGKFTHHAALAGTWTTEEASSRYRIEGMESGGRYASSFSPINALPIGVSMAEIDESDLKYLFPVFIADIHRDGSVQKALRLVAGIGSGGSVCLAKIITESPFEKLKTFAFFARGSKTSALTVSIDDGDDARAALAISLPAGSLTENWQKYYLRYGTGDVRVFCEKAEGGEALHLPDASATIDLSRSRASRLLVKAELGSDEELWIDEVMLEESNGQAALNFEGEFSYVNQDIRLGSGEFPILQGLAIGVDTSAAYHSDSYVSGGLSIGTGIGPLAVKAKTRGNINQEGMALQGGHELILPLGPFSFRDSFDLNPGDGSFGHEDLITFNAEGLFNVEAKATTVFVPTAADPGSLKQAWNFKVDVAKGIVVANLKAENIAGTGSSSGMSSEYFPAWINAFAYLLPVAESETTRRDVGFTTVIRTGTDREIGSVSASLSADPLAASGPLRRDEARLRIAVPLGVSSNFLLTPFYERRLKLKQANAGIGLIDASRLAIAHIAAAKPFWEGIPVYELFADATDEAFTSYLAIEGDALEEALFSPALGVTLSREFGSSLWDLFSPSALSLAYKRELTKSEDSIGSAGELEWGIKTGALNLFGSLGTQMLSTRFESDEYFSAIQGRYAWIEGESAPRLKLIMQQLVTFYAKSGNDHLGFDNRISLSHEPSGAEWSESLRVAYSATQERHWLLDLYHLAFRKSGNANSAEKDIDTAFLPKGTKPSIVSRYFEDLGRSAPKARMVIGCNVDASGSRTDASIPMPSFGLEQSIEGKLSVPEKLSVSTKVVLEQDFDGSSSLFIFGGSLSLSVTVSF